MSSRRVVVAGIVGGIVAGVALFAVALAMVAVGGAALGATMMAMVVLAAVMGFVLDATWLCLAIDRLAKLDQGGGSKGDEGEDGGRGPAPGPGRPLPPSGDPEWWPEFERDLGTYLEEQELRRSQSATSQPCSP